MCCTDTFVHQLLQVSQPQFKNDYYRYQHKHENPEGYQGKQPHVHLDMIAITGHERSVITAVGCYQFLSSK